MTRTGSAIVAVGASAGGVEALKDVVAGLYADLPAAVTVVLHVRAGAVSALPQILARSTELPVAHAEDGEESLPGHIYVAPPDCHLLVQPGRLQVVRGPKENGMRPAVDPLFRSAAASYGSGAIGVVLSGMRDDGAAGARAIADSGGSVIVQEPREADFPSMPLAAIATDHPNRVLPAAEIPRAVRAILSEHPSDDGRMADEKEEEMAVETSYATLDPRAVGAEAPPGSLTPFSCPECGGALWQVNEAERPRFRCRVGHAYSLESALEDQEHALDQALWTAFRALLERASLAHRLSERTSGTATADRFEEMERDARANAAVIRNVLLRRDDRDDD